MTFNRPIYGLLAALIAVPMLSAPALAANPSPANPTAKLYLKPATGSVAAGAELRVAVRVEAGEAVNAVQANLTYPSNMLQYVSVDTAGTVFDVAAPTKGGNGEISIARGALKPVTGDVLLATVVFKGIAHGNARVGFASGSAVPRAADAKDVLGARTGGDYTVTGGPAPAATVPPKVKPGLIVPLTSPTPQPTLTRIVTLGTGSSAGGAVFGLLVLLAVVGAVWLWRRRGRGTPTSL